MGLSDLLSDFYSAMTFTEAHAEAPPANDDESDGKTDESSEDGGEEKSEDAGDEKEDGGDDEGANGNDEGGDDGEEEGEAEEEEEEEEPEDPKPRLEEECAKSAQCAPMKHHYEDCVERVTEQHENPDHKGPKENCVEEFFHLSHCATQCAAPKLFRMLK